MSHFINRLRRNPKPKPLLKTTSARCADSCCYENSACAESGPTSNSSSSSKNGRSVSRSAKIDQRPEFRRSDTFTLKDGPPDELPDHIKYATYRKKKAPGRGTIIEQDVFESLYTKRPIKNAAPVKPPRTFPNALRTYPTPTAKVAPISSPFTFVPPVPAKRSSTIVTTPSSAPTTNRSPTINRKSYTSTVSVTSSQSQSPSVKPPEYFFGSAERPKRSNRPRSPHEEDRFRTITLRDVRRSFREKYLRNADNNDSGSGADVTGKHLPIWFVDVTSSDQRDSRTPSPSSSTPRTSTDRDAYRSLTYMEFNEPEPHAIKPKVTVNRKNTFRVVCPTVDPHRPDIVDDDRRPTGGLQRRETFKVHEPMVVPTPMTSESAASKKGYYLDRYRKHVDPQHVRLSPTPPDRAAKVIPVGIAVPYNSSDDRVDYRRSPSPPSVPRRQHLRRSPSPPQQRPQSFSTVTYTRKPQHHRHVTTTERPHSIALARPTGGKISFDALRKPAEPTRDANQTNLGFDRFYDPNYFVPKNQNLFGPLATAQMRAVNVVVQPKLRTSAERKEERTPWY